MADNITNTIVYLRGLVEAGEAELTWAQIADAVGLENAEQARGRWRAWQAQHPQVEQVTENNLVLNTLGPERIVSAEDLLAAHKIDTDVWEIARQSIRKWDGYSKISDKDLTFEGGKISGHVKEEGKINLVELFYVRVELVRKKPVQLNPVLGVLEAVEFTPTKRESYQIPDLQRVIYLPDPHFPYQDDYALSAVYDFAKTNAATITDVIWGGDVLDLREISTFLDLSDGESLGEALQQAGKWLRAFREVVPHATHHYLEGNHEKRLRISVAKALPALYGLQAYDSETEWPVISVPSLLNLDKMGIQYYADYPDDILTIKDVSYVHGTLFGNNGAGLMKLLREFTYNIVAGHDHRLHQGSKRVWSSPTKSKVITATVSGCLTKLTGDVAPGKTKRPDWHHGFTITTYYKDLIRVEAIPIEDGRFIFGNQVYSY